MGGHGCGAARRGQVALFILIGVILLLGIIVALTLFRQQSDVVIDDPGDGFQNPEVALQAGRMQERLDACLAQVTAELIDEYAEAGAVASSIEELEEALADDVAEEFTACFSRFNTAGHFTLPEEEPLISLSLGAEQVLVRAGYTVTGEHVGEPYTLTGFTATLDDSPRDAFQRSVDLAAAFGIGGTTPDGGSGPTGAHVYDAAKLLDEECNIDLYAYADRNVYVDMLLFADGNMQATFYDYNLLDEDGRPFVTNLYLPPCTPGVTA